jgi:hypothetical protein
MPTSPPGNGRDLDLINYLNHAGQTGDYLLSQLFVKEGRQSTAQDQDPLSEFAEY